MHDVSQVLERLPSDWRPAYETLIPRSPQETSELREALAQYLERCRALAQSAEFFDLDLAERTYRACQALLDHLDQDPSCWRAVAAAVRYFIAEDDAIGDSTLIGFDDDWQVVSVTCATLGVQLEES